MTKTEVIEILESLCQSFADSAKDVDDPNLSRVYGSTAMAYDAAISWVEEIDEL